MNGGRILIALLILGGAAGLLFSRDPVFTRFFYLGLLLLLISWAWTLWIGRSLQLRRYARLTRVTVGDFFEERFEILNKSRLLAPWVEVRNQTHLPFASGSRLLTFVRGRQKRQYLARTWLTRRGRFELGSATLTTGDLFGLFHVTRKFSEARSLLVLPMLVPVRNFETPPGVWTGGQVIRRKSSDVTPHAAGVREYIYGDSMKRIHWPTSVRRGQWMVKEFEQDPQSEVWLFLDAQRRVHAEKPYTQPAKPASALFSMRRPKFQLPPSTLEYAVTIAASLARYFLNKKQSVGFMANSLTRSLLAADRSERQESKILETLAFIEADGPASIAGSVETQAVHFPQGSNLIIITPSVESELVAALDDLRKRRLRPMVILLMAESFGGMKGSEKLLQSLAQNKIPAFPIYCDADLGAALSDFASQTAQEAQSWQRPRL